MTKIEYTQHDAVGNVVAWSTQSSIGGATSGTFAYDTRNRLEGWTRNGVGESFEYDRLGNLIEHGGAEQRFQHPSKPHAITGREETLAGQLIRTDAYQYDATGNIQSVQTQSSVSGASAKFYDFDFHGRLTCVSSSAAETCDLLQVVYDLSGRRLYERAGSTTRRFIGDEYVHITDGSGERTVRTEVFAFGERVASFDVVIGGSGAWTLPPFAYDLPLWIPGIPPLVGLLWCLGLAVRGGLVTGVARRPGTAVLCSVIITSLVIPVPMIGGGAPRPMTKLWILSDRIGSGIVELSETGEAVRHTRFKPFGAIDSETVSPNGNAARRRYFAGHPGQEETGLNYMKARWMDPQTGTFLSVDPVVPAYDDPQSLNAYAYARNNPISAADPTGQAWYFVDSYVTGDGMSVVTVHTNSAAAAGAAWFGPFEVPSLPTSATSGGGGFGGLGSVSMADAGGAASFSGIGALGGAAPTSQPGSNPSSPVQSIPVQSTPSAQTVDVGVAQNGSPDVTTDPGEGNANQRNRNSDTANGELLRIFMGPSSTGMKVRGVGFMASGAGSMGAGAYLMVTGATAATVSGPGLLILGGGLIVMGGVDWMLGNELAGQGQ